MSLTAWYHAMQEQVFRVKSAVSRAAAYVNMYENVLSGRYMKPVALLALLTKGVGRQQIICTGRKNWAHRNTIFYKIIKKITAGK